MNLPDIRNTNGHTTMRLLLGVVMLAGVLPAAWLSATEPAWWSQRGVTSGNAVNDYAAVNQGQVKNIAVKAVAELDANLPGGAGDTLHTLATKLSGITPNTNDYAAVNLGQLKAVAKPFYDRLIVVGYSSQYPWTSSANASNDYAMANIGQVKNLFSFDFTERNWTSDILPDWWKQNEFGTTDIDPTGDPDGDGLSNLEEYHQGTNPHDFYNGVTPTLTIVSGGNQLGAPGTMLAVPLSVKVNNGASNAPVTFSVTSGSALLTLTSDTTTAPATASVTVRSTSIYTGTSGTPTTVAQAYIWLAPTVGDFSTIQISATSGTKSVTLATTAASINSAISAPSNVTVVPTSPTTVEVSWTPSDVTQNTTIQVSQDDGATWQTVAVVGPDITHIEITGLTPNKEIKIRLLTGGENPSSSNSYELPAAGSSNGQGTGGTSSAPSDENSTKPLAQPILVYDGATVNVDKPGYSGLIDPDNHYLKRKFKWSLVDDSTYYDYAIFTIDRDTLQETEEWAPGSISTGSYIETGSNVVSDTYATINLMSDPNLPFYIYYEPATKEISLEDEYTDEDFDALIESTGTDTWGPTEGQTARAYWERTRSVYHYQKIKYHIKANVSQTPILLDVKFTPSNGDPETHTITSWTPTSTTSPVYTLDPKGENGGQNGQYIVSLLTVDIKVHQTKNGPDGSAPKYNNAPKDYVASNLFSVWPNEEVIIKVKLPPPFDQPQNLPSGLIKWTVPGKTVADNTLEAPLSWTLGLTGNIKEVKITIGGAEFKLRIKVQSVGILNEVEAAALVPNASPIMLGYRQEAIDFGASYPAGPQDDAMRHSYWCSVSVSTFPVTAGDVDILTTAHEYRNRYTDKQQAFNGTMDLQNNSIGMTVNHQVNGFPDKAAIKTELEQKFNAGDMYIWEIPKNAPSRLQQDSEGILIKSNGSRIY